MDTSEWMCHNQSRRFLEQADAIELYCKKKLRSHPDNHVGIFATGYNGFGNVVEPTRDLSKIMNGVCGFTLFGGYTALEIAMDLAPYRCFNLTREHKNKNLLKRILVFAGGCLYYYGVSVGRQLGANLDGRCISLDIVNFGTHREEKCRVFEAFVDEYNYKSNGGSCRLLRLSRRLHRPSILCLVEEGVNFDRKRKRDDSDDSRYMHGDGKKRAEVGMKKAV